MAMAQLGYIAVLALCGGLMGTVFDLYNTVTGASRWLRWLRPVLDLSFWMLSAVGVYYVVFVIDDGRVRLYTLILLLLGYLIYRVTFHHTVVSGAFTVVRWISALLRLVYRILNGLVFRPIRWLLSLIRGVLTRLYGVLYALENGLFWILRFWLRILKWPLGRRPWVLRTQTFFATYWEGFWTQASKWIKKRSTET